MRNFSALLAFLSLWGCHPSARTVEKPEGPGVTRPVDSSELGLDFLADTSRSARQAGASPVELIAVGSAGPGDAIEGLLFVPQGRCSLVFARGTEGIEDLDLVAYGDDGSLFGIDEAPDDLPTLLLCPESSERLFVSARVAQGQGLLALGLQDLPREKADQVAKAVGARNHGTEASDLKEAWPGLEESLAAHRENLGGRWVDQRRVALPVDSRVPTALSVMVPADRCLDALFLPGDDISQLEVDAMEPGGRIFARAGDAGRNRSLLLCAGEQSRSVTLNVRPHAGRGLAIAALSTTRSRADALDLRAGMTVVHLDPGRATPRPEELPRESSVLKLSLKVGEMTSAPLKESGCLRLDFVPQAPLLGYAVLGWDGKGESVGHTEAALAAPLFVCGDSLRLDAQATRRAGPFTIEVRKDPAATKVLLTEPLAASRLLSRGAEAGLLSMPSEVGKVERAELSSERLLRVPFEIPAAHCVTVFAGRGAGGHGLSARLVEKGTGLELDAAQGARSVLVRACSGAEHQSAVLELRTERGEAPVLFATRQQKLKP